MRYFSYNLDQVLVLAEAMDRFSQIERRGEAYVARKHLNTVVIEREPLWYSLELYFDDMPLARHEVPYDLEEDHPEERHLQRVEAIFARARASAHQD